MKKKLYIQPKAKAVYLGTESIILAQSNEIENLDVDDTPSSPRKAKGMGEWYFFDEDY